MATEIHGIEEQWTCGKGLAETSSLPAKLGELIDSVAENLEVHMQALDLKDQNARQEYEAYQKLAQAHREIAARLAAVAGQMAGYRDLPMGRHDEQAMSDPKVMEAFVKLMKIEKELVSLLQKRVEQDQKLLDEISGTSSD